MEDISINLNDTDTPKEWWQVWTTFFIQSSYCLAEEKQSIGEIFNQLSEKMSQGDSCLACEAMPIWQSPLIHVANTDLATQYRPLVWDAPYLYFQRYWSLEHRLAEKIKTLLAESVPQIEMSPYDNLLNESLQKQALNIGVNQRFAMISGGPGTGKTYILTRIVAVLKQSNPQLRIAMAAPTGKAAQRMQEALQQAFNSQGLKDAGLDHPELAKLQTQTLHRLLGMGMSQQPRYHAQQPLPYDVVVVDEASMLDLTLAHALFDALAPTTRLILLGDANQLSSVDVGYVLADLHQVPQLQRYQVQLVTSRRFSDTAHIGQFARFIYQQEMTLSLEDWLKQIQPQNLCEEPENQFLNGTSIDEDWVGFYPLSIAPNNQKLTEQALQQVYAHLYQGYAEYVMAIRRYQNNEIDKKNLATHFDAYRILVSTRHFQLGLDRINAFISSAIKQDLSIKADAEWYVGRPIMMTYNDYQLGLSNGDIGICLFNENNDGQFSVYFPTLDKQVSVAMLPQSILVAYALTIHKSQGSEFNHVAVVFEPNVPQLLSKELLYTGITRAKKMVTIYSDKSAFEKALNIKTQRISGLSQQISRII